MKNDIVIVFEMKFNSQEGQNNASQTVASLAKEIDYKNHQLLELEHKYNDTNALFRKVVIGHTEAINAKERTCLEMEQKFHESSMTSRELVSEKDMLLKRYGTEMSLMKSVNRKLENVVECQKKELERRAKELAESKTQNDKVHRDLKDEIAKLKDQLRDQISVSSSSCLNARINALEKEIEEKNEDILSFQTLNHILAARDFKSNEELQNCRRDLIDGLQDMLNKRTKLVIKRMGEVDQIPFREMCLERIPSEDWQGVAAKICSCWQDQVQDPLWHPFKIDSSDGITR
ncbi:factor of DNA methylation 1-like, partial [Morus notabilis]|uniref:factor of DNA methylation 1-like n=1 Tax=Morus notabilis TaxID=981085 RepID=UPI000CED3EB0